VAAWIECQTHRYSAPTAKQQLAAIRHLFDWLVTGQVVPVNPASSLRGPGTRLELPLEVPSLAAMVQPALGRFLIGSWDGERSFPCYTGFVEHGHVQPYDNH